LLDSTEFLLEVDIEGGSRHLFLWKPRLIKVDELDYANNWATYKRSFIILEVFEPLIDGFG
jgi:hypothetical protein